MLIHEPSCFCSSIAKPHHLHLVSIGYGAVIIFNILNFPLDMDCVSLYYVAWIPGERKQRLAGPNPQSAASLAFTNTKYKVMV